MKKIYSISDLNELLDDQEKQHKRRINIIMTLVSMIFIVYTFIIIMFYHVFIINDLFITVPVITQNTTQAKVIDEKQDITLHVEETQEDIIRRVAKENSFDDPDLLVHISQCESGNREAEIINQYADNPISTAYGPFQYLKGTWEDGCTRLGVDWTLDDRTDIEKATLMTIFWINEGYLSKWNESAHCWG